MSTAYSADCRRRRSLISLLLDCEELIRFYGYTVTRDQWIALFKPHLGFKSASRSWDRFKLNMKMHGVPFEVLPPAPGEGREQWVVHFHWKAATWLETKVLGEIERLARNRAKRRHYMKHRERVLAKNRSWARRHRKEIAEYKKRWTQEHPEKVRAAAKKKRKKIQADPKRAAEAKEYSRRWYLEHRERRIAEACRRQKERRKKS